MLLCVLYKTTPSPYEMRYLLIIKYVCFAEMGETQKTRCLEVVVVVLGKRLRGGSLEFLFVLVLEVFVELELWRL